MSSLRKLYLVRHGQPDLPAGQKFCLGRTDIPLGVLGRLQACLLAATLPEAAKRQVFCSPLSRAVQTAAFLTSAPLPVPGLEEMSTGEWDGLSFVEIRRRWPSVYAARGIDPAFSIPGAESYESVSSRANTVLRTLLLSTEGDLILVAHATIIGTLVAAAMGLAPEACVQYRLPCGAYFSALYDETTGNLQFNPQPNIPHPLLTDTLCQQLMNATGLPPRVFAHCEAVADEALRIADVLDTKGLSCDRALLRQACLLHDIARADKHHEAVGADLLESLGYPNVAALIRVHGELPPNASDMATVLFIADKEMLETKRVPVASRYAASREKCRTAAALVAHERRMQQALELKEKINKLCQQEIIL